MSYCWAGSESMLWQTFVLTKNPTGLRRTIFHLAIWPWHAVSDWEVRGKDANKKKLKNDGSLPAQPVSSTVTVFFWFPLCRCLGHRFDCQERLIRGTKNLNKTAFFDILILSLGADLGKAFWMVLGTWLLLLVLTGYVFVFKYEWKGLKWWN